MANENAQPVVTGIPFEVYQRQQLAEELKNAPKIDEVQPGGIYEGEDGELHDAEGKPVKRKRSAKAESDEGDADPLEGVELTPAAKEKATEKGLVAEDFKHQRRSGATGFTVEDVDRIAEKKAG